MHNKSAQFIFKLPIPRLITINYASADLTREEIVISNCERQAE